MVVHVSGKYADAITEYTKAINAHPATHVYYSNRAMACIKLFRFEQVGQEVVVRAWRESISRV